jgi:pimeloyl-ACP methyl ester carboxylesterase
MNRRPTEDVPSFTGRESRAQLDAITLQYVMSNPAVVGRGFLAMFRYDATAVLPAIPVPVLVVTADGDTPCLPEASEYMVRTIPHARLVRLKDGRHCAVFEFHAEFHAAVTDFVATSDSQRLSAEQQTAPAADSGATASKRL